jgi:alkyl hydroperoxide reductase subunit D
LHFAATLVKHRHPKQGPSVPHQRRRDQNKSPGSISNSFTAFHSIIHLILEAIMSLDSLFEKFESPAQRDLKLNFTKFFSDSGLSKKEAGLITLACAESVNSKPLIQFAADHLKTEGATPEEIQECRDAAAIMGLMNCYYRFRHFVGKEEYKKPAGLRMNVMARPVNGKNAFEMMALAVSVINGCESCVKSHEESLVKLGESEDKIHDLARLASIVKALEACFRHI